MGQVRGRNGAGFGENSTVVVLIPLTTNVVAGAYTTIGLTLIIVLFFYRAERKSG